MTPTEDHPTPRPRTRRAWRRRGVCFVVAAASIATACGSSSDPATGPDTTTSDGTETTPSAPPTAPSASDDTGATTDPDDTATTAVPSTDATAPDQSGVVVALGEEFVLADLLALGVVPVASTATVPAAGFQGITADTTGIDVLPSTEINLERLASYQPDVIVTTRFVLDEIGAELLDQLADVVVIDDDTTAEEQIELLADRFDRTDIAVDLVSDLTDAREQLAAAVAAAPEPCVVSVATVYPGPSVAAWVDDATDVPASIIDAGCTLDPSSDDGAADRNGRLFLSSEQLELLDADRLVLLQSDAVDGEAAAIEQVRDEPLWQALPAVSNEQVATLDRLAYPGLLGQLALLDDLEPILTR